MRTENTSGPAARAQPSAQYGWSSPAMPQALLRTAPVAKDGSGPAGETQAAPMEGAVLYRKRIDNSTVRYTHDPSDRRALRMQVSWGLFVVFVLLVFTGPRLWVRHSGYRQARLVETIEQLTVVRDQLKVQRGHLADLRRVAALAERRGLRQTEESRYRWFAPQPESREGEPEVARLFNAEEQGVSPGLVEAVTAVGD